MGDSSKRVGASGEAVVMAHLEWLNWRILATNYRCRDGEIDIIAEEPTPTGPVLVFMEVKTRRGTSHGAPIEAVDARKARRLQRIALAYLGQMDRGGEEPACRFDIAEVIPDQYGLWSIRLHRATSSLY